MPLLNLQAHEPALQLLRLPFEFAEEKPDELQLRALLRAAYRLLTAMCSQFSLTQAGRRSSSATTTTATTTVTTTATTATTATTTATTATTTTTTTITTGRARRAHQALRRPHGGEPWHHIVHYIVHYMVHHMVH